MKVSARLTARHEHDRCARALAAAVASYLVSPSIGRSVAMHEALVAYTEARTVLDG